MRTRPSEVCWASGLAMLLPTAWLACAAAMAAAGDGKKATEVELSVLAPDGKALADAELRILPRNVFYRENFLVAPPGIEVRCDARGRVRFSWPPGLAELLVLAKHAGYGATGTFEVSEGEVARPHLPPLVPYGIVEGAVPKAVLKPGAWVEGIINSEDLNHDNPPRENEAVCDAGGHFILDNLRRGSVRLTALANGHPLGWQASADVAPGQRVVLEQPQKAAGMPELPSSPLPPPVPCGGPPVVWAAGTVRDESGRPVEGASVLLIDPSVGLSFSSTRPMEHHARILLASYAGGERPESKSVPSAKSDKLGRWMIRGSAAFDWGADSVLIAYKSGYPVSTGVPIRRPGESKEIAGGVNSSGNYDLVLPSPSQTGCLELHVAGLGVSAAGEQMPVVAHEAPWYAAYVGEWGNKGAVPREFVNALRPDGNVDDDGVARFRGLLPGRYQFVIYGTDIYAVCDGVAIRPNETRRFTVTSMRVQLSFPPRPVQQIPEDCLQVRRPDGQPFRRGDVTVLANGGGNPYFPEWPFLSNDEGFTWLLHLDEHGTAEGIRSGRGMTRGFWPAMMGYHGQAMTTEQNRSGDSRARCDVGIAPHYVAPCYVVGSELLQAKPPTVVTARRHEPGSLVAKLENADGTPRRGYVFASDYGQEWVGSTDERGEVRFEGLQRFDYGYRVEALVPGGMLAPCPHSADSGAVPADNELLGRLAVLPRPATVAEDTTTRVVVRPEPVGYLRGVLRPPRGHSPEDYQVEVHDRAGWSSTNHDGKTGEFWYGPLPEGKTDVRVSGPAICSENTLEVEIRSNRVAHIELTLPREPRESSLHGIVFMADGKTPAFNARLIFWDRNGCRAGAEYTTPEAAAMTDALGRIVGSAWFSEWSGGEIQEHSGASRLVTWLPGITGAVATLIAKKDLDRPLKIVLPPPLAIAGKVTVGGKPASSYRSQIHLLAAYEGEGALRQFSNRRVSAEADGSFELPALTPGAYCIQAALDDIWLSRGVRVTIGADHPPPKQLTLDIGEPGPPSVIRVVDRRGQAVPGADATVVRPDGPLAELLWSMHFESDGAGVINIPPLEAGTHRVKIHGAQAEYSLVVPPLSQANITPAGPPAVVEGR